MGTRDSRIAKIMRPRGKTCVPIRVILRFRALCTRKYEWTSEIFVPCSLYGTRSHNHHIVYCSGCFDSFPQLPQGNLGALAGNTNISYCTCPAGPVTYNIHSSCKHMHFSFKSVCNKEHKGVTYQMTSASYSSQSTCPTGLVLWEELLVLSRFHS